MVHDVLVDDRHRRALVGLILLVGLVVRIALILHVDAVDPDRAVNPDTHSYVASADALLEEHRFTRAPDDPTPMFVRTPGYPVYLAAVRSVAGDDQVWPLIGQALLAAMGGLLLYATARRLWDTAVAVVGLLLVTLDPLPTALVGTLLTETLFTTLFLAFVYALVRLLLRPGLSPWWALAAGAALAAATLTRPTTYYLPLVVLAVLGVRALTTRVDVRRVVVAASAFLVPVMVLVGGWQLRNAEQVGSGRLSGVEAINLYWYGAAFTIAEDTGAPTDDVRDELVMDLFSDFDVRVDEPGPYRRGALPDELDDRQAEVYGEAFDRGVELVTDRPVAFLQVMGEGLAREMVAPGETEVLGYVLGPDHVPRVLTVVAAGAIVLGWATAAVGFVWVVRRRQDLLLHLTLAVVALYVLAVSAMVGEARIRAPVVPVASMYAAFAIVHVIRATAGGREASNVGASGAVGSPRGRMSRTRKTTGSEHST